MSYPFDCITEFMFFEITMDSADVIMVPGGSHPQLMESAAELFHQGFAPYILPSGGSTSNVKTTEWEFLRSIGIKLGVPESAILREDKATNTFENSRFSKHVLHHMGIKPTKAIFVSCTKSLTNLSD